MIKILAKLRARTLIILFIELLMVSGLITFYYYDLFGFQSLLTYPVLFAIASVIFVFNSVYMLAFVAIILKNRQKKDLKTADLLGSDIPEAYRYTGLGIILLDQDDQVIWVNEVIQDLQPNLIETNVHEWQAGLTPLIQGTKTITQLNLSGKKFEVKYLSTSRMFILKDITAYEDLLLINRNQSPVVGYVVLDNYEENAPAFDEKSDYISNIRSAVINYFGNLGFVIQRIRSDSYFFMGAYTSFTKMKEDKFRIVETIFGLNRQSERQITISIGMAYGVSDDFMKLNGQAIEALELAVARGGNQGVIEADGNKEFFGGYRLSQENEMKTAQRIRERNDKILRNILEAKKVYIVGHLDADLDALGSALGVRAICEHLKIPSKIIFDYAFSEKRARQTVTSEFSPSENKQIFIKSQDAISEVTNKDLIVVVDVSRPSLVMGNQILEKDIPTIVIDHHKRTDEFIAKVTMEPVIDTSASSATELVVDIILHNKYFKAFEFKLPSLIATIMLSGIYLDTNFYKLKTVGPRTFDASRFLIEKGADTNKAHELLKEDYQDLIIINRVTASAESIETDVLLAAFNEDELISNDSALIAKVANAIMDMRGVKAAIVIGKVSPSGLTKVSCRSDGSINVAMLMEKMGGGGHYTAAGYETKVVESIQSVKARVIETLKEYLTRAREMQTKEGD
jgi:c-di-AMP phosphodiesterase-like protein